MDRLRRHSWKLRSPGRARHPRGKFSSGRERNIFSKASALPDSDLPRRRARHRCGPARRAVAWLKARYQKALARNPVQVRPIREANLEAVQRLVAASRLLKVEEVQVRGPGVCQGFDAAYSFFAGPAERLSRSHPRF